jgi:diguanylate cyclase (GGDEF)-like protein
MREALRIAEGIEDTALQAYMLDGIGSVHASAGHTDIAFDAHQRSLALHRYNRDETGEAIVLNNMAYTQMDRGDLDGALESAAASLRYAEKTRCAYLEVGVLDTVAEIHRRRGELDAADTYADRGLALARKLESETDEATIRMSLARIACARGRWAEALGAAETALDLAERRGLRVEEYECHALLSKIRENTGELPAALAHYKRYHDLKQTRVNEETEGRLANLRVTHQVETARKDAEIHRLRSLALEREVEERRVAQARLEARASLDPLTGLFNRGHLAMLAEEVASALSGGRSVSVIMFDVDRFKKVNDTRGHRAGDRVLMAITNTLADNARKSDVACRYGGDEFLVLLFDMDADAARKAAERLREAIAAAPVEHGGGSIDVTISAGVASAEHDDGTDLDTLIERADRALYAAKESGRNRVIAASELAPAAHA